MSGMRYVLNLVMERSSKLLDYPRYMLVPAQRILNSNVCSMRCFTMHPPMLAGENLAEGSPSFIAVIIASYARSVGPVGRFNSLGQTS